MRGRKPVGRSLKLLAGSRSSRSPRAEAPAYGALPQVPDHLKGRALEEWERILPILEKAGTLSAADGAQLTLYCETYARWRAALEALERDGLTFTTDTGQIKAHPAAGIASACEAQIFRVLSSFGCDPASRSRVAVRAEVNDALGEFLRRKL
jgi:P27 family predicted phage terminase small subunit